MEEKDDRRQTEDSTGGKPGKKGDPAAPLDVSLISRRQFIKVAGVTGAALGLGGIGSYLTGCGGDDKTTETTESGTGTTAGVSGATGREIKIGFVTPLIGALAGFGVPDQYCVERW